MSDESGPLDAWRDEVLQAFGVEPWQVGFGPVPPVPRRVRMIRILTLRRPRFWLRCRAVRAINAIAFRIADAGHVGAAERIWRAMDKVFP